MSVEEPWSYCCWLPTQTASRQTLSSESVGCLLSSTDQQPLQTSPSCTENSCNTLPGEEISSVLWICKTYAASQFRTTASDAYISSLKLVKKKIQKNVHVYPLQLLISSSLWKNDGGVCQLPIICSSLRVITDVYQFFSFLGKTLNFTSTWLTGLSH